METKSYRKLFIALGLSWATMYAVMFLNVSDFSDIYLSQTRFYMSLLMTAPMAVIMLLVMSNMYVNKTMNRLIFSISILIFVGSLVLLRTQLLVGDRHYLKAMIPHHSSAILTSEHAHIQDREVRALADSIAASQRREIDQMKGILERIRHKQ